MMDKIKSVVDDKVSDIVSRAAGYSPALLVIEGEHIFVPPNTDQETFKKQIELVVVRELAKHCDGWEARARNAAVQTSASGER